MRERLYRSRDDRMLFGVAGGMAEWMDLDPAIVRLVWALLILAGGVGLLLYIVAAIVIPEAPYAAAPMPGTEGAAPAAAVGSEQSRWEARQTSRAARRQGNGNGAVILGVILVVLGGWFLVDRYVPSIDMSFFMPGVLIVVGIILVIGALGKSRGPDAA